MRRLSHTAVKTGAAVRVERGRPARAAEPRAVRAGVPRPAGARETVGAAITRVARALKSARVHFGHGTDNARDEAAELVFFAAGLSHDSGASAYTGLLTARRRARIDALLQRRIAERLPLPYLTHRAFFAGLEFFVDQRVLVPRSP